jgi:hypothetical protein
MPGRCERAEVGAASGAKHLPLLPVWRYVHPYCVARDLTRAH